MRDVAAVCVLLLYIGRSAAEEISEITEVPEVPKLPTRPYDFLYKEGVDSYLANEWEKCVKNFEEALQDWHWWRDNVIRCRKLCSKQSSEEELISTPLSNDDRYYERVVRNTLCVIKCKKDVFGSRMDRIIESNVDQDFELRKPYDYLQLCYYKLGRVKEAANAAATVLMAQPDHEVMKTNLQYYIKETEINSDDVLNMELKEYGKEYILGTLAYDKADYEGTLTHMEKSLAMYYEAYEDCRFLCENPFNQGWHPDFISSIANHFTFTLRCKRRCAWQLSDLYGEIDDDFFSSYFNYLQYSYFQRDKMQTACEAVASYLVMSPEDEIQNRNKQFYLTQASATEDMFVPRKDVVAYKEREVYEEKLLDFIEVNFGFLAESDDEEVVKLSACYPDKKKAQSAVQPKKKEEDPRWRAVSQLKNLAEMGVRVLQTSQQLGGQQRVLADGFASPLECLVLSELTKVAAVEGDGYRDSNSPHTSAETFQGVTLARTGLMVHAQLIDYAALELILDVTDLCRDFLEQHFHLQAPLYFTFTHLVCRTARPEMLFNRSMSDLSHEVHVDNCILQDSGECLKQPPAYTFRDYSAILYLNQEFRGGEFIFTHDRSGMSYEAAVVPQCGRLVGFSSGAENPHGVLPVLEGSRCAIGMWFTHDKRHKEVERTLAELLLEKREAGLL